MGFDLIWTDEQVENAAEDFDTNLSTDLANALESKNREVKWCKNMAELSRRFQDLINLDGLKVAEIRFSSMSAEYRALCVVLPEKQNIFYYTTVPKKGSHQERQLEIMRDNSEAIKEFIKKSID